MQNVVIVCTLQKAQLSLT